MIRKVVKVNLTSKSFKQASKSVQVFKKDFNARLQRLVTNLSLEGISVARIVVETGNGDLASHIAFKKKVTSADGNIKSVIVAYDTSQITSRWITLVNGRETVKKAKISPILMAEFGSGPRAGAFETLSEAKQFGLGRGTFPGQTHAYEEYWHWMDTDHRWHTSKGITPSMPVHKMSIFIQSEVSRISREVFS